MSVHDFNEIRPYYEEEIPAAVARIAEAPELKTVVEFLMPDEDLEKLKKEVRASKTKTQFQMALMDKAMRTIANKFTEGVTAEGIDKLKQGEAYLYLANHRDIILDSSFLAMVMLEAGFETSEMTWGDNLMVSPFIIDVGKVNGMITVFREGSPRELLRNSQRLSNYIRQSITQRKKSVWIAHHKGRAKDGNDTTDMSVLKMLLLSAKKESPVEKLKELNIRTVTVSYEWEPCDARKVKELYHSQDGTYIKEEMEDLESIIGGVLTPKGRVHLVIGDLLNNRLEHLDQSLPANEIVSRVAKMVDLEIYKNYKLWPSNYLAYDLLKNEERFSGFYTSLTGKKLEERYQNTARFIGLANSTIRELFLRIYANPVINKLKHGFLR